MSIRIAGQVIASAGSLTAHNEDPNAHPDIRELISQGGGGGNAGSADIAKAIENQNKESGTVDPIYNWLGTQQEYEEQNVVQEHPDWVCFITDDSESGEEEKEYYTKEEIDSKISEVGEDVASNTQGIGNVSEEVSALSDRVLVLENNTSGGGESESAKVAEGVENKNDNDGALEPIYHWIGSKAEYEEQKIKEEHPDWVCFIIDDVSEENDGSGNSSFPLFYHTFADHILNDASWLRADTFSWQSGDMYVSAYNHLVEEFNAIKNLQNHYFKTFAWEADYGHDVYTLSETPKVGDSAYFLGTFVGKVTNVDTANNQIVVNDIVCTRLPEEDFDMGFDGYLETIGSTEITYYRAKDGHKIVLADQEDNVSAIYRSTGVAWYYILDTKNKRFKLPRTKHNFAGIRTGVGNFVEAGLPNHYHVFGYNNGDNAGSFVATNNNVSIKQATESGISFGYRGWNGSGGGGGFASSPTEYAGNMVTTVGKDTKSFDGTTYGTYGKSDTVQPNATEQYLYFYVGNTVRTQTEVDVGTVTEQLNGKQDVLPNNVDYVVESYNDGTNWYRVYKSGWLEQGGIFASNSTANTISLQITFPKPFGNSNYSFSHEFVYKASSTAAILCFMVDVKTETGIKVWNNSNYYLTGMWTAKGQGAF